MQKLAREMDSVTKTFRNLRKCMKMCDYMVIQMVVVRSVCKMHNASTTVQ
jgi:hypothetical protein